MTSLRSTVAGLALLTGAAWAQPAGAQCFWDGVQWVCWQHPLFPGFSRGPYWEWSQGWGGPNWHFYGWRRFP